MEYFKIYCEDFRYKDNIDSKIKPVTTDIAPCRLNRIGNAVSVLTFTAKERDYVISILHENGINIYGFKRIALDERTYRVMTE